MGNTMRNPIYILLNGPPSSGKSTLIARGLMYRFKILNETYDMPTDTDNYHLNVIQESFANPMKQFIASALGMKYADMKKEVMMGVLQGYTVREFLIDLSERYMKVRYGDDIFGRMLMHRVLRSEPLPDIIVSDDCGFEVEAHVLGMWKRVVRVTRPGFDFSGDSRGYLPDPAYHFVNDCDIGDPKGKEAFELKLDHLANWCIDQLPVHRRPPTIQE